MDDLEFNLQYSRGYSHAFLMLHSGFLVPGSLGKEDPLADEVRRAERNLHNPFYLGYLEGLLQLWREKQV